MNARTYTITLTEIQASTLKLLLGLVDSSRKDGTINGGLAGIYALLSGVNHSSYLDRAEDMKLKKPDDLEMYMGKILVLPHGQAATSTEQREPDND